MPGVPVLQGVFTTPGVTVGAFYAGASGQTAAGGAATLVPGGQWAQITLGAGYGNARSNVYTYGGRVSVPLGRFIGFLRNERFGAAVFAGAGGGSRDSVTLASAPAGVAVAYRRELGATRAIHVYAAPFLSWNRSTGEGLDDATGALFRVSAGVDLALTRRIGLTLGWEGGAAAKDIAPGPRASIFGGGLSYAFR